MLHCGAATQPRGRSSSATTCGWCRYSLGLLQKDVAAMVGIEEWLYRDLESGAFHRSFTPELADKHPLLGKWTKDHQSEVLLPSGGKP